MAARVCAAWLIDSRSAREVLTAIVSALLSLVIVDALAGAEAVLVLSLS
jgi:hypothetical protein